MINDNDTHTIQERTDAQKMRRGWRRIWHATGYSIAGLKAALGETAFRQEAIGAICLLPLAFIIGKTWLERALLIGSVVAVLVVELLNTAIESTVDRIGSEWNTLSKRAKDMGSAAVLLTLLWAAATWIDAIHTALTST